MSERPAPARVVPAIARRDFIRLAGATVAGLFALDATSDRMRIVASITALPLDDELAEMYTATRERLAAPGHCSPCLALLRMGFTAASRSPGCR